MTTSEHHHFDRDEVAEYLRTAAAIVDELALPADLRNTAFSLAVSMLSNKVVTQPAPPPIMLGQPIPRG